MKHFDPGPSIGIDSRFAALPALTKRNIRDNFPAGILPEDVDFQKHLDAGEIRLVETSGTTDDKITNVWNQSWWDASERSSWKLNSLISQIATGNHREAILVNPKNVGIISDETELSFESRHLSRFLYLNEKTDLLVWTPALLDRMISELELFKPAVLEANPSYLARLCRYIAADEKPVFQPGAIVFTYEYSSLFHIRQIRRVFPNVPLVNSYGTTETGYVFMECERGKLHQNSDFCRVDFQPLKEEHGGPLMGRILVTPLGNPWCYYLRFDTGDLVHLEESGKCECGRNSGLILSSVNGRKVNLTFSTQGRMITLYELDQALSTLEDITEYQLIQPDAGVYELHLANRLEDRDKLDRQAAAILKKVYGQTAMIIIIHESDIAPENSGKYLLAKTLFQVDLEKYLD